MDSFLRIEKKYRMNGHQYEQLMKELAPYMEMDEYGKHTISNIYYDTPNFDLIRRSLDKPVFKEKVRIRAYGEPIEVKKVYLEVKRKYDKTIYKRRVKLRTEEALRYMSSGIKPQKSGQIMKEMDYLMKQYPLQKAFFIAYDRIALFGKEDPELRLTIDSNLRSRRENMDFSHGSYGESFFEEETYLMEIKLVGALPMWMTKILNELQIFPCSFSKYGQIYAKAVKADPEMVRGVESFHRAIAV